MGPILTHLIHLKTTQDFSSNSNCYTSKHDNIAYFSTDLWSLAFGFQCPSHFMAVLFSLIKSTHLG